VTFFVAYTLQGSKILEINRQTVKNKRSF